MVTHEMQKIDELVKTFFSVFTTAGGKQPDWHALEELCIPEVQFIKKDGPAHTVYSLKLFIQSRHEILAHGALRDFQEREVSSETKVDGHIAQRFAYYEKEGLLAGDRFKIKGSKVMQFIKVAEQWKLTSALWEDKQE